MGNKVTYRGVNTQQEQRNNTDIRDTRRLGERIADYSTEKWFPYAVVGLLFFLFLIFPALAEILFLVGLIMYSSMKRMQKQFSLPFKMPKLSGEIDNNEAVPQADGTRQPGKAKGVVFFGNEQNTKNEIWFTDSDVRQHILMLGTTGAGKAFLLNEKFETRRGWIKNKNLTLSDEVMTPFGFSKIQGIFPQEKQKLLKLTFENGVEKTVSEDHLWEYVEGADNVINAYQPFQSIKESYINQFNHSRQWFGNKVTESHILKEKIKQSRIYIPHSAYLGGVDIPLDLNAIADAVVLKFKNEHLPSALVDQLKDILDSSIEQRHRFKEILEEKLLLNPTYINYFNLNRFYASPFESKFQRLFGHAINGFLFDLYTSLGFVAKREVDILGRHSILLIFSNLLEVTSIESAGEDYCQCIKVAHPSGLVSLKENIISHNTEALLSIASNALIQGSGLIMIDGKADLATFAKMFSLCRTFRREDDLLCINYITSGKDVFGKQEILLSNTINPFVSGSSGELTEMTVSLMDAAGGDPMWQGRAISLLSGVMMSLVWQRDNEGLLLGINKLREHLQLEKVVELAEKSYDGVEGISSALNAYLRSIPGYNPAEKDLTKQQPTVFEQHGYLQMQFTKVLGTLADSYGHIFNTNLGHVVFRDVVLNRRILLVLLPALEKSEQELQTLGKIQVASLKSMMASTLGSELDSTVKEAIKNRPTNDLTAFFCILDEYGYYIVKGSAVIPAQARSLGFSMLFAGQDLPAFQKNNNKEEAGSIIANCNIKIFGRVEDPGETFNLIKNTLGRVTVEKLQGKRSELGLFGRRYYENESVGYETRDRAEWLDLKEQKEGQAHIVHGSTMARINFFYADPKLPEDLPFRVNYFQKVEPPTKEELEGFLDCQEELKNTLQDVDLIDDLLTNQGANEVLNLFSDYYYAQKDRYSMEDVASTLMLLFAQRIPEFDMPMQDLINKDFSGLVLGGEDGQVISAFSRHLDDSGRISDNDIFLDRKTMMSDLNQLDGLMNEDADPSSQNVLKALVQESSYPTEYMQVPYDIEGEKMSEFVIDFTKRLNKDNDVLDDEEEFQLD